MNWPMYRMNTKQCTGLGEKKQKLRALKTGK